MLNHQMNNQPAVIKNIYACDFVEFMAMSGHLHIFRLRKLKTKFKRTIFQWTWPVRRIVTYPLPNQVQGFGTISMKVFSFILKYSVKNRI